MNVPIYNVHKPHDIIIYCYILFHVTPLDTHYTDIADVMGLDIVLYETRISSKYYCLNDEAQNFLKVIIEQKEINSKKKRKKKYFEKVKGIFRRWYYQ